MEGEAGNSIGFATDSLRITDYSRNRIMEEWPTIVKLLTISASSGEWATHADFSFTVL
jgi:hypothetical protein